MLDTCIIRNKILSFRVYRKLTHIVASSTSLLAHRNLFWHLTLDERSHDSGMSRTMTASPESFFRTPWRLAMRRSAEKMRDGYYPKQWTSLPMPSEQIGRGSLLNRPSYPPEGPISWGTKLNWTEPISTICITRIDDSLLFNVSRKPAHTNQNHKFVCYQQAEPSAHSRMQPAPSAPMRTKPRQGSGKVDGDA